MQRRHALGIRSNARKAGAWEASQDKMRRVT